MKLKPLLIATLLLLLCSTAWGATYYIDYNRGDDANAGTSEGAGNAWKNLGKIASETFSAGDTINLACDSTFNLSSAVRVIDGGLIGTSGSRITIQSFTPDGVTCTQKPTITRYIDTETTDWTWDAAESAWYTGGASSDLRTSIYFGASQEHDGIYIKHFVAPNTAFSADYQFSESTSNSRLYVYTPSDGNNPVTYYGGVRVQHSQAVSFEDYAGGGSGSYVTWSGIRFKDAGIGVLMLVGSGVAAGNSIHDMIFSDCDFDTVAYGIQAITGNANSNVNNIYVRNSTFSNIAGMGIQISGYANTFIVGGSSEYSNTFDGCNIQRSNGGCFYSQGGSISKAHIISYNTFNDAKFGVSPDQTKDGSAIYFDLSSSGSLAHHNTITNSAVAILDSSGYGVNSFLFNKAYNVGIFAYLGGQATDNNGTVNVYSNTALCDWGSYGSPFGVQFKGCIFIDGNYSTGTFNIINNILKGTPSEVAGMDVILSLGLADLPTYTFTYNNLYGYRKTAADINDTDVAIDGSNILADPLFVSAINFNLKPGSPAINAGTDPFSDGDGDQYGLAGRLVWSDTTDAPYGTWGDGVEIGGYGYRSGGMGGGRRNLIKSFGFF